METNEPFKHKEIILGEVVGKANHYMAVPDSKGGGRRIIKDAKIREYESLFKSQCKYYAGAMIHTPFELHTDIYYSNMRADLDNSLKTLLDCLMECKCIVDDNQCKKIVANKHCGRPRVEFTIIAYPEPDNLFPEIKPSFNL